MKKNGFKLTFLFGSSKVAGMEAQETWKSVEGYEGLYEVSDLGRVRSLDRVTDATRRNAMVIKGKVLKPGLAANGYYTVALCKDGKPKSHTIHSMVAAAFLGPRPDGMVVDHIDGTRVNNSPTNLRYVSYSVNMRNLPGRPRRLPRSGERGVHKNGNGWCAGITHNGSYVYLGQHRTIEAASAARRTYEAEHGIETVG